MITHLNSGQLDEWPPTARLADYGSAFHREKIITIFNQLFKVTGEQYGRFNVAHQEIREYIRNRSINTHR